MQILYNIINDRAKATWVNPDDGTERIINAQNFIHWVQHWLKVAFDLETEFALQNLPQTADAVAQIILDVRKAHKELS